MKRIRLAQRRRAVGHTQESLAEQLHVDPATVRRWEHGQSEPQPWQRPNLATVLRVTVEELDDLLTVVPIDIARHPAQHAVVAANRPSDQVRIAGDLVEFARVLDQRGIGTKELAIAEFACAYLDQNYARLGPDEVFPNVQAFMAMVLSQLDKPQTVDRRRRLCALAGRVAGLRAWLCFDLNVHDAAERWYRLALSAAEEAEDWSLAAWLLGARSLIPWLRGDYARAVTYIERGIHLTNQGSDATTRAWLYALHTRGRAGLGDRQGSEAAQQRAEEAAERSNVEDRRHSIDFSGGVVDLRYYIGSSKLLLRRPGEAAKVLQGSLDALPSSHSKARAVLSLTIADAALQSGEVDAAVNITQQALTLAYHQPILPILHQARRLHQLIGDRHPAAAGTLDEELERFAVRLSAVTGGAAK